MMWAQAGAAGSVLAANLRADSGARCCWHRGARRLMLLLPGAAARRHAGDGARAAARRGAARSRTGAVWLADPLGGGRRRGRRTRGGRPAAVAPAAVAPARGTAPELPVHHGRRPAAGATATATSGRTRDRWRARAPSSRERASVAMLAVVHSHGVAARHPRRTTVTHFRETVLPAMTLPQLLRRKYTTVSYGKIFHEGLDDAQSWTPQSEFDDGQPSRGTNRTYGDNWWYMDYDDREMQRVEGAQVWARHRAERAARLAAHGPRHRDARRQRARLLGGADAKKPFFIAVGFVRPHLPWTAPAAAWQRIPKKELMRCETSRGYTRAARPANVSEMCAARWRSGANCARTRRPLGGEGARGRRRCGSRTATTRASAGPTSRSAACQCAVAPRRRPRR